jgi:hypothetical protein
MKISFMCTFKDNHENKYVVSVHILDTRKKYING